MRPRNWGVLEFMTQQREKKRIEFRVVSVASKGPMAGTEFAGHPRDRRKTVEMEAYEAKSRGNTDVRIQTRTIVETPWIDLSEKPHE